MFKLNLTREAEETQFGESDNMPTEHVRTEVRRRKEDFWLETQTRFTRELTGASNGALKVEAATEEPASNV